MLFHRLLRFRLFLSAAVVAGMQTATDFVLSRIYVVAFAHAAGRIKFRASRRIGYRSSVRLSAIGYRLSAIEHCRRYRYTE
jgi:uncharacterized membrane protein